MAYAWVESIAYNLVAVALGGLLAYLLFPYLQQLTGITFLLPVGWFAATMVLVAVLCGLLAGWYPALMLSAWHALEAMKQRTALTVAHSRRGFTIRQAMVTLQFGISMLLITSALIAYDQFRFLTAKNLGFKTEQILAIPNVPNAVKKRYQAFRDQVASLAGVQQVATCMQVPSEEIRDAGPVLVAGVNDDPDQAPIMDMQIVDNAFVAMMDISVLAGNATLPDSYPPFIEREDYSAIDHIVDRKRAYLINETAMKQLGWATPQEAVGQRIRWSIGDIHLSEGPIVGVVQDYHQETLKNKVDPTVMTYEPIWLRTFLVKVETQDLARTIADVQAIWDTLYPAYPMEYHFLDELFEQLYSRERVQLQLLSIFSGLAIFIAFLGLFSLVAYSLKTRVREIAIRRVLGANLPILIRLIGREYLSVMLLGGLLAVPLSYFIATQWLQAFAYHVGISVWWYALTMGLIGTLLLITISLQTRISTSINPTDILKE